MYFITKIGVELYFLCNVSVLEKKKKEENGADTSINICKQCKAIVCHFVRYDNKIKILSLPHGAVCYYQTGRCTTLLLALTVTNIEQWY